MDMLWIKFLSFVSVFCLVHDSSYIYSNFKDKHKVAGDINSLSLLVQLLNYAPLNNPPPTKKNKKKNIVHPQSSVTVWDIFIKLYKNVYQVRMMCRIQ